MKKKKLMFRVVAVLLVVSVVAGVSAYVYDRNKDYNNAEKITIAMGTVMTQKIYGEVPGKSIANIISIVSSIEDNISLRKDNSALSQLNEQGSSKNLIVADALRTCNEVSKKTDGAFDVTTGKAALLWNESISQEKIPSEDEIRKAMENCGYEKITVKNGKVSLEDEISVDLSTVEKGVACDYIMNYLRSADVKGGVVSVGSSILAYGQYNKAGDKWRVAVRHPRQENKFLGVISIDEGFVSTVDDYGKNFEKDGKRYHHIIDGNTGYPSQNGLVSVTVVSDSGILSDVLSVACFLLGTEKGTELMLSYGASGIFVDENMNITTVGDIEFEYSE